MPHAPSKRPSVSCIQSARASFCLQPRPVACQRDSNRERLVPPSRLQAPFQLVQYGWPACAPWDTALHFVADTHQTLGPGLGVYIVYSTARPRGRRGWISLNLLLQGFGVNISLSCHITVSRTLSRHVPYSKHTRPAVRRRAKVMCTSCRVLDARREWRSVGAHCQNLRQSNASGVLETQLQNSNRMDMHRDGSGNSTPRAALLFHLPWPSSSVCSRGG